MSNGQVTGEGLVDDSAFGVFVKLDNQVVGSIKLVNDLEREIRSALSATSLTGASNRGIDAIRQTNKGLTEQEKVYRQLAVVRERNTKVSNDSLRQLVNEREKRNQLTSELRQEAKLNNALEGSYKKLRLERDKVGRTLRDLIVSEKASAKEIQKVQKEFDKLDSKVKKADATIKNHRDSVGNYQNALKPTIGLLRELIGVYGVVQTVRIAIDFASEASKIAKEAKGVEFAFERLGDVGVKAFGDVKRASKGALSDLSIKRSLVELDNFNIDLERAGVLFEFLTVRSLQTGQSIDKLKDSLVEGLSKESLLRIDNLGISAKELNEQLKETPNFVEAVAVIAKREVEEAGNIIEDAANSSEALSSAWENLKVSVGQGVNQFRGLRFVANIVNRLNETQQAINISYEQGGNILDSYLIRFRLLTSSGREENRRLIEEKRLRDEAVKAIQEQTKAYIALNGSLGPLREGQQDNYGFSFAPPEEDIRKLSDINKELEKQRAILEEGNISTREEALAIQNRIESLEKERDAILGSNSAKKAAIQILEGTVTAYQNQIRELTELRDATAQTSEEYERFNDQIFETERKIKLLTEGIDKLQKVQSPEQRGVIATSENPFGTITTPDSVKINEGLTNEIIRQEERKDAILRSLREGQLADFKDFTDEETEILKDALSQQQQLREEATQATQDLLFGSIQSIFDARVTQIDDELELQREALDATLNNTLATDKQKLTAQRKYDQEERRLLNERRKREKQAFLVQQGLAVAQIAIDLAKTITAINLTAQVLNGLLPGSGEVYRNVNIPIAIGTAAAQTGLVLAQSFPAFFKGKNLMDNYEGPATWGEHRKEVKVGSDGSLEVSPNRTTPFWVKKDDIITPSIDEFKRRMSQPNSEVFKRVNASLMRDTDKRSRYVMVQSNHIDTKGIEDVLMKAMRKYSMRPIVVNAKVVDDRKVKSYL